MIGAALLCALRLTEIRRAEQGTKGSRLGQHPGREHRGQSLPDTQLLRLSPSDISCVQTSPGDRLGFPPKELILPGAMAPALSGTGLGAVSVSRASLRASLHPI